MESTPGVDVPSWLDDEFIQQLLRDDENDQNIIVQNMDVRFAMGKGENYMSIIYRIVVNLTKGGLPNQRWLIVKSLSQSEMFVKFAVDSLMFEKETRMHLETLPSMYQLEENRLSNEKTLPPLSCKAYKTTRPYTIVMEDLQQLGYKMANRLKGLDLKHSRLAIKGLARLHALSWGLLDKDPKCMEPYAEKFFCEELLEENSTFLTSGISLLSAEVKRWEGYEHFGEKLKNLATIDKILGEFKIKDGGLGVLNHGDCWVNNMLFRYNERGDVEDVRFVDLQLSRYASPALDIQYFLFSSPEQEIRTKHWDELVEEYHQTFVTSLEGLRLERPAPTLDDIKKEIEEKTFFGLYTACTVLPIISADPNDTPDTSEMTIESFGEDSDQNEFSKTYSGLRFRKLFQNILLHFENIGFL